jgi:uncharacterized protein YdbL (DUF1318 family)
MKLFIEKCRLTGLALILLAIPLSAMAMDLQEAKSMGLVGEKADGYLGIVKAAPEVPQLVQKINGARKQHYQDIAARNKISLDTVEKLAGKKAIDKTASGQFVQMPSGEWLKK